MKNSKKWPGWVESCIKAAEENGERGRLVDIFPSMSDIIGRKHGQIVSVFRYEDANGKRTADRWADGREIRHSS